MAVSFIAGTPDQLTKVRAELEECGTATVTPEEMEALSPDDCSVPDQFLHLAEIARAEDWEIDFSTAGVVRLSSPIAALLVGY